MIQPKIGLVTVLFNCPDVLPDFYQCLSKQSYKNYWLYIIDNSTNDDSYQLTINELNKLNIVNFTLLKNKDNVGVAAANNQGIDFAINNNCDYVLLLNNDIEFHNASLLNDIIEYAELNNENIIVPKITYFDSGLLWYAGGKINEWKGVTIHVGERERDSACYNVVQYTNYAPTCFMLIKSIVFKTAGVMDEDYFVYYDDTDFVYRTNQYGYKILYHPGFLIAHKVSSSTGGNASPFSVYYGSRNRIYFIMKNLRGIKRVFSLFFTIVTRIFKREFYKAALRKRMLDGFFSGFSLYKNMINKTK